MVTDYDCWKEDGEHVTVEMVSKILHQNSDNAQKIVLKIIEHLAQALEQHQKNLPESASEKEKLILPECLEAQTSLKNSILTPRDRIPNELKRTLAPLISGYVGKPE